ncbi:pseudaminic acid cytidylyltransferase [Litorivicinus sp.]|nr:pseudaminic acid cytidylyltransferase [Litorivicinus sp.]MDC1466779.1 pseudaminic acid cytidylyltransferase [Litorivicinus sp.]
MTSNPKKKYLAVIPARGGSKRIKKKNIKKFREHPIIAWSINAAKKSNLFDTVMVSTDCDETALIAKTYGASVPFQRSAVNSDDNATIADALIEVISQYESQNIFFDAVCCLYATAPFITTPQLAQGLDLMTSKHFDSVFPITPFDYPINRALRRKPNGLISFVDSSFVNTRSQDIPESYHDAGMWIWFQPGTLKDQAQFFSENTGSVVIESSACHDIDTETDWRVALIKHEALFPDTEIGINRN